MKTLLEKVKKVEEEAKKLIAEAENDGQKKLEVLVAHEAEMLHQAHLAAEKEGQRIIQEKIQDAQKEVHAVREAGLVAVQKINQVASKNQAQAVAKIQELFEQEYGHL